MIEPGDTGAGLDLQDSKAYSYGEWVRWNEVLSIGHLPHGPKTGLPAQPVKKASIPSSANINTKSAHIPPTPPSALPSASMERHINFNFPEQTDQTQYPYGETFLAQSGAAGEDDFYPGMPDWSHSQARNAAITFPLRTHVQAGDMLYPSAPMALPPQLATTDINSPLSGIAESQNSQSSSPEAVTDRWPEQNYGQQQQLQKQQGTNRKRRTSTEEEPWACSAGEVSRQPPVKKTSHNMIEKRYRTNLNDKIAALRDSVPSLRVMTKPYQSAPAEGEYSYEGGVEDLEGLTPAHKLNKATILSKATEYIRHLERRNKQLLEENDSMKMRLDAAEKLVLSVGSTSTNASAGGYLFPPRAPPHLLQVQVQGMNDGGAGQADGAYRLQKGFRSGSNDAL